MLLLSVTPVLASEGTTLDEIYQDAYNVAKKATPKLDGPLDRKVHEFEVMRDCRKYAAELLEVFDNAVFGKAHYVAGMYFAERVQYGGIWDYKEYLRLNTEYYEPELDELFFHLSY